ncbi:LacI family DNA-binding transcriptional regulator [Litorihabitans aurantiacus]|uniref:LacI family transcriptional regulator n=1 Tax=Litorihabitans aurantiacus TaxID=1930061 RepID=A0AA37XAR3_9MICO|nr:LacI family DNA-binding transcriptional regulator [Litorihabitans aurantiacus]GMA30329.1 LacI family transcriptional regulator [Litorihabitans aurantiacus]
MTGSEVGGGTSEGSPGGPTPHARTRPAGMTTVARLAGVSHQTVSRVLNDHPSVRPETRERVLRAMAELDYRPNRLARALVTSRSGLIGVVTGGSARFGPTSTLLAVEEAARAAGFATTVTAVPDQDPATMAEQMAETLRAMDSQAVEGVIVIAPRVSAVEAVERMASRAPLLVIAAGVQPTARYGVVNVDQAGAARDVTAHLLAQGHTRIAHLAGPSDWFDARERHRGWAAELAAAGLEPGPVWEGDWTARSGFETGRRILALAERPTAVVACNDLMALGLVRALSEGGLDVPGDVSVTGFDDIEGTDYLRPPLTTVRQDFRTLAETVVGQLVATIGGGSAEAAEHAVPIPAEVVVRDSTASPTARD